MQRFASQHLSLDTYAASVLTVDLAPSVVFLAVGGLIFWRRSDWLRPPGRQGNLVANSNQV